MGWIIKTLIIRDAGLLWILSFVFEWMEVTFRHILPNFWECWWDHFLLDVFGCNWLGIFIGFKIINWFQIMPYKWYWNSQVPRALSCEEESVNHDKRRDTPIIFRSILDSSTKKKYLFMLNSWRIKYFHSMFSSFQTYLTLLLFIFVATAADVNVFFLKAQLGLYPSHWIILLRTTFVVFAAMGGIRDVYNFITISKKKILGIQAILNVLIVFTEFLVILRFWQALPSHHSMPLTIQYIWIFITTFLCVTSLLLFLCNHRNSVRNEYKA